MMTLFPSFLRKNRFRFLLSGLIFFSGILTAEETVKQTAPAAKSEVKPAAAPVLSVTVSGQTVGGAEKKDEKKNRFRFLKQNEKQVQGERVETQEQETVKLTGSISAGDKFTKKIGVIPEQAERPKIDTRREAMHFYDDFTMLNGDEEISVSLIFNSAPLLDVLPSFADALGFSFLADSNLSRAVVTLNIDQKMTRRELWNTFDRMLLLSGAGVTVDGSLLRIMSLGQVARQPDSRLKSDATGEIFYYPLKNSTAKEAAQQIRPYLGQGGICTEVTRANALLIADERANMPKIKLILDTIDQGGKINWKRKVFECRNILPTKLVEELQNILPVIGFNVYTRTDRSEQPGSVQLNGIDRISLLVVSAATQEAIREISQWVDLLDGSDDLDQERMFVYKVRHSKAENLAQTISLLYDMQGNILSIDTSTGKSRLQTLNSTARKTNRTTINAQGRTVTAASNTQVDRVSNIFDTPVRVFADGVLNRLIIRTTPRTYASIKALLDKLDLVPAQVLLQVLIVEVKLNDATQFGVEFSLQNKMFGELGTISNNNGKWADTFVTSTDSGTSSTTRTKTQYSPQGFTMALADPDNPQNRFGFLHTLAQNTIVKVISSPQLLVSSNTEAQIQVGQRVPYTSSGITNTSSSGQLLQNTSYEETGIILKVTPQVTSNDYIALQLEQKLESVSSSAAASTAGLTSPTFDKTEVKTSMTIANGKTMMIGGLIQNQDTDDLTSIPIINRIPVLNRLFGDTNKSIQRTETLILITGYIVTEKSKVEDMMERYDDAVKALDDFHNTLGNRYLQGNENGAVEQKVRDARAKDPDWLENIFGKDW